MRQLFILALTLSLALPAAAADLPTFTPPGATLEKLWGEGTFTAPLAIFRLLSQPGAAVRGQAMALSVVVGVVVAAVAGLLEVRRGPRASTL